MGGTFELFDHTADIGVRVRAATLAELVSPATDGLYAVIGDIATTGRALEQRIELTDDEPAVLLRDYLAELLHAFDHGHRRATDVKVRAFDERRLDVSVALREVDDARSDFEREAKAVTYHELAVRRVEGELELTFIVDI